MTTPPPPEQEQPQAQDASGLIPALLTVYTGYLAWRAANGPLPPGWKEVAAKLGLAIQLGDHLALLAARALARQREGLGPGADGLWTGLPQGVQAGVDAGLQTVAEALIWTDQHEELDTKDEEGIVPTMENPPEELAFITVQAVSGAAQSTAADLAGWRWKTWQTVGDADVRPAHQALKGTKVPLDGAFHTVDGDTLRYPGDPLASISNRIGCRCSLHFSR